MNGNSEEARTSNNYLTLMKSRVFDIQMEPIHKNEDLSLENFKSRILGSIKEYECLSLFFKITMIKLKTSSETVVLMEP